MSHALLLPLSVALCVSEKAGSRDALDEAEVRRRLGPVLDRILRKDEVGRLVADWPETSGDESRSRFATRILTRLASTETDDATDPVSRDLLPVFYACAADALREGEVAEASLGLVSLLPSSGTRADGLLGLAVCATRLNRFDDALELALQSRRCGNRHPRACYVAGLAELERGNRAAAQGYLACASRLARRDLSHAEDLRMAQSRLLMMHMSEDSVAADMSP